MGVERQNPSADVIYWQSVSLPPVLDGWWHQSFCAVLAPAMVVLMSQVLSSHGPSAKIFLDHQEGIRMLFAKFGPGPLKTGCA